MLASQSAELNFRHGSNVSAASAPTVSYNSITEDMIRRRFTSQPHQLNQLYEPSMGRYDASISALNDLAHQRHLANMTRTHPGLPMHHFPPSVGVDHYSQLLHSRSNRLLHQARQSSIQESNVRHALDSQALANHSPFASLSTLLTPDMKNSHHHSSSTLSISPSSISASDLAFRRANIRPPMNAPMASRSDNATNAPRTDIEPSTSKSKQLFKPIPLAMPADKYSITPLHCFVRQHCVELFTASETDVFHRSSKGKRRPIQVGRVGIRCSHCAKATRNNITSSNNAGLNKGSVYFPTTIASIYNATMNLLQRHLHVCENVPPEIIKIYNELKLDDARSGTSKKYWIESAKQLGLIDTPNNGIQYSGSPMSIHELINSQDGSSSEKNRDGMMVSQNGDSFVSMENKEGAPLVSQEHKYLATNYSYALLSQMRACTFTDADRLGKRKGLPLGFAGLACRHCYGGYGSGRFFPSNIKTMSDTSKTLNVLHNHMMRCRKCPREVQLALDTLRMGHDEERSKMKFGSQKAFFVTIWKNLHGEMPTNGRKGIAKKSPKTNPKENDEESIEKVDEGSPERSPKVASIGENDSS